MTKKLTYRSSLLCLCAMLACIGIHAQIGTGAIQGTIVDNAGKVIPGASVTAVDPRTGYTAEQKTAGSGNFRLDALPPSIYTVTVSAPGFSSVVRKNVEVDAMTVVALNLRLEVGTVNTTITVTSASPQLNTSNGTLEISLPNDAYTNLPLEMNGSPKSPLGFLSLVPGTQPSMFLGENINGGPGQTSFFYINGMPIATSSLQGDDRDIGAQTSTEIVDQFQVLTSGIPAYYAGNGVTNLITKSGTNHFHGDVYENIRNTVFDAAGYFAATAPVERQNEFGVTLGGPILHNKLFFLFNYDGYHYVQGQNPTYYSIPTTAERSGDFSALLAQGDTIYDPATTSCAPDGICTRQAFPGNIIPSSRISKASSYLQSFLPAPTNSDVQNNLLSALTGGVEQNMYEADVDYQVAKSNHITWLTQHGSNPPIGLPPNGGPMLPLPYTSDRYSTTSVTVEQVQDTATLTPHMANTLGLQYNRFFTPFVNPTRSGNYATKAGLSNLPAGEPQTEFPPVTFDGLNSPTLWDSYTDTYSWQETTNTFTLQDNLLWTRGKHNLTFGGQIQRFQDNVLFPSANYGINFSNDETAEILPNGAVSATTGNSYASFLLGDVDSASLDDSPVGTTGMRYTDYSLWAQDDWKVMPHLVINAGLRWDIPKPGIEVHDLQSWLNPTVPNPAVGGYPGVLQFAGSVFDGGCYCGTDVKTHYAQLSPRLGFAYALAPKTALRGSFGIIRYNSGALNGNAYFQGTGYLGFTASPSAFSPNGGITPAYQWDNPFPSYTPPPFLDPTLNTGFNAAVGATGGSITYNRPDTAGRMPYTEDWNLTVERELSPSTVLSLSYSGSRSLHGTTPGGEGIYSDQLNPKYLQLGGLLTLPESPTTLAEAQAIMPGVAIPYAGFSGTIGQMLLPFPQYAGVADPFALYSSSNYNSMQAYVKKTMSHGLLFLVSYTWSKLLDDSGMNMVPWVSANDRSAYDLRQDYALDGDNSPNVLSFTYVYQVPVGHGRAFGGSLDRPLNAIVGGWQISGIDYYNAGTPIGPIGGVCTTPYTGGCYASYNPNFSGPVRINGSWGSQNPGTPYINVNAFQNATSYTFGNTPRTAPYGLHYPWYLNEDLSLSKVLPVDPGRGINLKLQADAFNLFNRSIFGDIGTNIDSSNFGQVGGQINQPRQLQFEAYFRF